MIDYSREAGKMDKNYLVDQLRHFASENGITIPDEILGQAVSNATFKVVSKGERLSSIGDDTTMSGIVLDGIIRSYYVDSEGNDITRGFVPQGGMFMDEGFFIYAERQTMWEALEESTVMMMQVEFVKNLIRDNVELKDVWITLLESAMRYKIYRENGFLVENATERYIHFKKRYPELSRSVPQKHIATYLGIAPESLSRIRSAMKEE